MSLLQLLLTNFILLFQISTAQNHPLLFTCMTLSKWCHFCNLNDVQMKCNTAFETLRSTLAHIKYFNKYINSTSIIKNSLLKNDSLKQSFLIETRADWENSQTTARSSTLCGADKGRDQSEENQNRQRW